MSFMKALVKRMFLQITFVEAAILNVAAAAAASLQDRAEGGNCYAE